jgi:F0F1-type ATP synthase membrane subunit b/b'
MTSLKLKNKMEVPKIVKVVLKMEIERLTATAKAQIVTIEARVRKQISEYVVTLALQRITMQLEGKLSSSLQQQIIDRNISKLAE